ncbi:MAG: hypothetical protein ISR95_02790 [Candidatus Marinimicrobia bacterium]|nr:hypothetical protein [Candidatus Neomarinimicrobiota bacterium]
MHIDCSALNEELDKKIDAEIMSFGYIILVLINIEARSTADFLCIIISINAFALRVGTSVDFGFEV